MVFISIALVPKYSYLATALFIYACLTDMLDGFLARKLSCTSNTGKTLDLFSDKYLTVISFAYAIARGIPVLPCGVAILREMFLLAMRSVYIEGKPLFPPQRLLGTIMVIPIWSGTVLLLQYPDIVKIPWKSFEIFYWIIGGLALLNLVYKTISNWKLLVQSFKS